MALWAVIWNAPQERGYSVFECERLDLQSFQFLKRREWPETSGCRNKFDPFVSHLLLNDLEGNS